MRHLIGILTACGACAVGQWIAGNAGIIVCILLVIPVLAAHHRKWLS